MIQVQDHTEQLQFVEKQIGNTPLMPIRNLWKNERVKIYAKLEWKQLSGSVKARAAFRIFEKAILSGNLKPGMALLDASSGNTGIAYATIGKKLGIEVVLCIPENASKERKEILTASGATIIYTSKYEGTDGAQLKAKELYAQYPGRYYYADQYSNKNNYLAHYHGTSLEILNEVPDITHFIAGLGTTGTFIGNSLRFLDQPVFIERIALHPNNPLHGLEGWKHLETAIVPPIYRADLATEHRSVDTEKAYTLIKEAYKAEQLQLSPSSAANLAGALELAASLKEGVIVTIFPDNADKYSEIIQKIKPW